MLSRDEKKAKAVKGVMKKHTRVQIKKKRGTIYTEIIAMTRAKMMADSCRRLRRFTIRIATVFYCPVKLK
jgi:hypothetical protein